VSGARGWMMRSDRGPCFPALLVAELRHQRSPVVQHETSTISGDYVLEKRIRNFQIDLILMQRI
jgi:hypothetical protein